MQVYKVNILKKVLGIITLLTLLLTSSLVGANQVRIMPLGDSITDGADTFSAAANTSIAYRGPLWTKLSAGGYNVDFVGNVNEGSDYLVIDPSFDLENEGHDGVFADDIALNVTGYLNANPADIVLLHIGTNDLFNSETIASTVEDVNTTLENIDSVANGTKVILARIINHLNGGDQKTTDFNIALDNMVQKRITNGDDIIIVDMENGADINYTTDMIDELHPNVTGYEKMADLWYSTLSTVLTPIVPVHLWKLDEETATTTYVDFYSVADGNCTDPGCPVPVVGQVNGAQTFDGIDDEIDVMNTANFDWTADANVTIEFWMKSDAPPPASVNDVMVGRNGGGGVSGIFDIWYVGIEHTSGKISYGLGNRGGALADLTFGVGTSVVTNSKWNHIVYVVSSDRIMVYINGQIDVDVARKAPGSEHIQGTPVNIGHLNNWDNTDWKYTGQLDEIAVYNSVLSPGLIYQHYINGFKPHLAEITVVPTPTNNNTPDYTFSSDKDGTITYGGSCSSAIITATVGNNTITFDTLADGTYSDCTITVTAADGNVSDPLAVSEFVIDTTAPILTEVTAVSTPTNDTTPEYTFSSDGAGTITYGGSCDSAATAAVVGNNTITFNALTDGTYSDCTITVTDAVANASTPLVVTAFEVNTTVPDTTAPTLTEVTAVTTPTNDTTPEYTFSSDEAGTITYGGSCDSAATAAVVGNNTITFNALADGTYSDCTITVTDAVANASTPLVVTAFVVDTTVPIVVDPTDPIVTDSSGGGCSYNPNSKNFDMTFLLMMTLGLLYPFRRRFIK